MGRERPRSGQGGEVRRRQDGRGLHQTSPPRRRVASPTLPRRGGTVTYAELQPTTNFSFLRGASHPGELVLGARALGISAIGICDRNTLAGEVAAGAKGREIGQRVM